MKRGGSFGIRNSNSHATDVWHTHRHTATYGFIHCYICCTFVCLCRCWFVCSPSFLFFLLALYALGSTFPTLNCAAVCTSLYICIWLYVCIIYPYSSHLPGRVPATPIPAAVEKKDDMWVAKWQQKYLRFIMTTDISLFDICVGCLAGVKCVSQFHTVW